VVSKNDMLANHSITTEAHIGPLHEMESTGNFAIQSIRPCCLAPDDDRLDAMSRVLPHFVPGLVANPIGDIGAAEIRGLDCSRPLSAKTLAALEATFLEYPILAIRDQVLTAKQQVAFSQQFGVLEPQERSQYVHTDDPGVLILSNEIGPDGTTVGVVDAGDFLHSDSSHMLEPVKTTILYSVKNPRTGGDTEYCNMYMVYDALPDDLRTTLAGRTAVHHVSKARNPRVSISKDRPDAKDFYAEAERIHADVHQPIVRTHPQTGRQAAYVSPRFTLAIDDMDSEISEQILTTIFNIMNQPRFRYRHVWRENDLVMWDNRCLTHRATGGYVLPDVRRMHRTTVCGDKPFYSSAAGD
jgi:taurine dioxygenase